jgi:integrase
MSKAHRHLPARMRQKQTSSGRVYYYYDTCAKPRKWLALGCDYLDALKKYADYEREFSDGLLAEINQQTTFKYVADRYLAEVLPQKAVSTQKDNLRELPKLLEFFNNPPAPINDIRPVHIREYLDWRSQTAKIRANREVALFSHIFNKAREWGYTANDNPCRGVKKNKERGRDVYVTDDMFWDVYQKADRHIQQLMMVAFICGQRVADTLKMQITDFYDGALWISQNKSGRKLRVALVGVFAGVVNQILDERGQAASDFLFLKDGQPITYGQLRYGMDKARRLAGIDKVSFQFRDLRAKAGTDKDSEAGLDAAKDLLGHKNSSMTNQYIRHRKGKLVSPAEMPGIKENVEQPSERRTKPVIKK